GVEAAALAPAILLLHSPGAVMLVCVTADAIAKLLGGTRRWTLSTAFDLAQLSIAYAVTALFADALPAPGGAARGRRAPPRGGRRRRGRRSPGGRRPPRVLPRQHRARVRLPGPLRSGGEGPPSRDRSVSVRRSDPSGAPRDPGGPRLPDLRRRRHPSRLLSGR